MLQLYMLFPLTTTLCLFTNWSWVKFELRFRLVGRFVVAQSRVGSFVCLIHVFLSLKTLSDNFLTFPLNKSIAVSEIEAFFLAPFTSFSGKHFYSPAEKFSHGKAPF